MCVCVCWGGRHQVVVCGFCDAVLGTFLGFDPFLSFVPSLLF